MVGGQGERLIDVTIGRGSVVGTASVVTKDVPPFTVVAGVPAKIVKHLDPTKFARIIIRPVSVSSP